MANIFKKRYSLICISVMLIAIFWKAIYIEIVVGCISKKDREQLEWFFQWLNDEVNFAWVVSDVKPLADCNSIMRLEKSNELFYCRVGSFFEQLPVLYYSYNNKREKAWQVWEKYKKWFPTRSIKIVKSEPPFPSPFTTIMVINQKEVKKQIERYRDDFSTRLGYTIDENVLVKNISKYPGAMSAILQEDHYLLGILYGFGAENARIFARDTVPYIFSTPPYLKKYNNGGNCLKRRLTCFLVDYVDLHPFSQLRIPGFLVDAETEETQQLEQKYRTLLPRIEAAQKNKSLLKWSLLKLLEH